jgi:hypothetical protein
MGMLQNHFCYVNLMYSSYLAILLGSKINQRLERKKHRYIEKFKK